MTQRSSSRKASATGSKSKVNSDFNPVFAYDLENTRNSVGLVLPSVLESFLEDTRAVLEQPKRKTTLPVSKKSSKTTDVQNKNEEPKRKVSPNRVRRTKNVVFHVGEKKLPNYLLVDENPSISTKTPNKSKTKIISNELKSKTDINSKDDIVKTIPIAKNNEVLQPRELRSTRKYTEFKRELKSVNDFSIENMDWYFEDENYYKKKLQIVLSDFNIPKQNRREGNVKLSYNYLLLDSRRCKNKRNISWLDFIEAIFYIGKGKNKRAFEHVEEAEELLTKTSDKKKCLKKTSDKKKCLKIKEIWDSGNPIKVFIVTENVIAEEAFTREAAMIEAMGLRRLCNKIRGSYYGVAITMKARECLELGATLLMEARDIFRWKETIHVYPKKKPDIVTFVRPNYNDDSDEDELYRGY